MPVPKRKTSKARRNQRSANKGLKVQAITHCPNSGIPVMPHTVCLESGYYKGVKVIETKFDRLERRTKERQEKMKRQQAKAASQQPEAPVEEPSK